MRRTLVITRHYAPEPTGSAPVMQQLAEWLALSGDKVEVITVRPSYPARTILAGYENGQHDNAVENGVHVRRLTTRPLGTGIMTRAVPEALFLVDLLRLRLTGGIKPCDQVISLCPSIFTVVGALPLTTAKGRHIVIVHDIASGLGAVLGSRLVKYITKALRVVEAWALGRADQLVVLSEAMKAEIQAMGVKTDIAVLPPHVDVETIQPMDRPEGAPPTIMYSGNLGRKQGLEQLLDLAVELQARAPKVRLVIRGDGAAKDKLIERIRAENLENVYLEPLVAIENLAASLAEGDVHLVPQLAEGGDFAVPSKAFAIMAAGRPFIATAYGDSSLARLADRSQAFLCVSPNDTKSFADAVMRLLGDDEERRLMGARGRDYVEREVSTAVVMKRFSELLSKAG